MFRSGLALALPLALICLPALAAGEGSGTDNPALLGLPAGPIADTPPPEDFAPLLDIDWSVGLRGAYAVDAAGGEFTAIANPEFTLTHAGPGRDVSITGSGELVTSASGEGLISSLTLGADASRQTGTQSHLDGTLDLSLTQSDLGDVSLPANTAIAPLILAGDAGASFTQGLGLFEGTLRGSVGRSLHGVTTLDDSSTVDNTAENDWRVGAGARLGFKLTPQLTPFIDGGVEWQRFDAPSPTLLAYLDAVTWSGRTGLSYQHNSTVSAEIAGGVAWRDYVDPSLADAASVTADGSITFNPNDALQLNAKLTTGIAPSELTPGDSVVTYASTADARYVINPWVTLRGSAGWSRKTTLGTGDIATTLTAGVGADYLVTDHVAMTLDYAFSRTDAPPDPLEDTHTVSVGVRYSR